jgi:hypothetical protein
MFPWSLAGEAPDVERTAAQEDCNEEIGDRMHNFRPDIATTDTIDHIVECPGSEV